LSTTPCNTFIANIRYRLELAKLSKQRTSLKDGPKRVATALPNIMQITPAQTKGTNILLRHWCVSSKWRH
jgi:GTP cyclohydrolase I